MANSGRKWPNMNENGHANNPSTSSSLPNCQPLITNTVHSAEVLIFAQLTLLLTGTWTGHSILPTWTFLAMIILFHSNLMGHANCSQVDRVLLAPPWMAYRSWCPPPPLPPPLGAKSTPTTPVGPMRLELAPSSCIDIRWPPWLLRGQEQNSWAVLKPETTDRYQKSY